MNNEDDPADRKVREMVMIEAQQVSEEELEYVDAMIEGDHAVFAHFWKHPETGVWYTLFGHGPTPDEWRLIKMTKASIMSITLDKLVTEAGIMPRSEITEDEILDRQVEGAFDDLTTIEDET